MKTPHVLSVAALALFLASGSEANPMLPGADQDLDGISLPSAEARGDRGEKGPKEKDPKPEPEPEPQPEPEPEPDPEPIPGGAQYQLAEVDDFDPLWRFTVSGNHVLLQTDPSITSWGTDYWSYWSDPYAFHDGVVDYTVGLTHTTYVFTPLGDDRYDVTKTLVVQPYNGGGPTTTVTHPGIYGPVN